MTWSLSAVGTDDADSFSSSSHNDVIDPRDLAVDTGLADLDLDLAVDTSGLGDLELSFRRTRDRLDLGLVSDRGVMERMERSVGMATAAAGDDSKSVSE